MSRITTDTEILGLTQARWVMEIITESKTTKNEPDLEAKGEKEYSCGYADL